MVEFSDSDSDGGDSDDGGDQADDEAEAEPQLPGPKESLIDVFAQLYPAEDDGGSSWLDRVAPATLDALQVRCTSVYHCMPCVISC